MILDLKGTINEEMVSDLVNFINEAQGTNKKIYLQSQGGFIYCAEQMLDIINENAEEIEFVGHATLESSAFELFFKAKCKKRILNSTRGMLHFATADVTLNQNGKPLSQTYVKHLKEEVAKRNDEIIKKLKLTAKEISKYNKGEDVEFSYKRMLELINNDTV